MNVAKDQKKKTVAGSKEIMKLIRSKNTKPELHVRKLLRDLGYHGYRLHRKDLPGCPDIAFIGKKKAIFIHGCFWHGHDCKVGNRRPRVNTSYWIPKIERNQHRDSSHLKKFCEIGWEVLVIWECELKNLSAVSETLCSFMQTSRSH